MFRFFTNTRVVSATVVGGGFLTLALVLALIHQVSVAVSEVATESAARSYVGLLADTQDFYARAVVGPAIRNGVRQRVDYQDQPNSMPYPATFMHGLVADISRKHAELNFRFFSDDPFYEREKSGPQDRFEREALDFFKANPSVNSFARFVTTDGGERLRYAHPIRMLPTCVSCHNSHPDSPRQDWSVGELRGVHAVTLPQQRFSALSHAKTDLATTILISLIAAILLAGGFCAVAFADQAKRHQTASDEIEMLVWQDTVTDLANRRRFLNRLGDALASDGETAPSACVVILDLDGFKSINDLHGHAVGDSVLRVVGDRIRTWNEQALCVARLGSDEFAILLDNRPKTEDMDALVELIGRPIELDGRLIYTGTSVGVSFAPDHGVTVRELMAAADLAMYHAKSNTQKCWSVFARLMLKKARQSGRLASAVRAGLETGQFDLFYQPQICLASGRLIGFEALARWQHPNHGLLAPGHFLKAAEEHNLMVPLSDYLADRLIVDAKTWQDRGLPPVKLAFNIHMLQVNARQHLKSFEQRFLDSGLDPSLFTFEITEACVIGQRNARVPALLSRWMEQGFRVALDDFGTGYTSLTHLKTLAVNEIKIDRSCVEKLLDGAEDQAIVHTILKLADDLGLDHVVEGIEIPEQAKRLRELGAQVGQGSLFSKPMPRSMVQDWLQHLASETSPGTTSRSERAATKAAPVAAA